MDRKSARTYDSESAGALFRGHLMHEGKTRPPDVWRTNPSPGAQHKSVPSPGARCVLFTLLLFFFTAASVHAVSTSWQKNPQGQVRLVAPYATAPGQGTVYFGLHFKTIPGWHVYWKNPGDAGYPMKISWKGSTGFTDPEILWPMPQRYVEPGDLKAFGYTGEVVYPLKAKILSGPGPLHAEVQVSYLTCDESCVPYKYTFTLDIPRGTQPQADAEIKPLLDKYLALVPSRELSLSEIPSVPSPGLRPPSPKGRGIKGEGLQGEGGFSLPWMVLLALLGGLILNIMPCVLPVLSIKLLGILQSGGRSRVFIVRGALASAAGILVSFLIGGGVAILAKEGGAAVGWGVQFQNPVFVGFLAGVVFLFALNLWGVFEITLPRVFGHFATTFGRGENTTAYFMSGVFATLLATPCSAPFLGTAMGFALAQSQARILAVFMTAGIGMALPYGVLAVFPGSVRWLPRPGAWMGKLRVFMGFLLALTALWLFSILATQVGWIKKPSLASFDPAAIPGYLASGHPVFVDVTADWCFTCKYNEKAVLESSEVLKAFEGRGIVVMKADWTQPDAAISDYLKSFNHTSIPFYVLYRPGQKPVVLSEFLTQSKVLLALQESK